MQTLIVALMLSTLILSACNASVPTSIPLPAVTETAVPQKGVVSAPKTGSHFAIYEIGLGPYGYVALTNFTGQPASLRGLFLCQGETCFELPGANVPAGGTVRVALGDGNGLENVVATSAALGGLQSSDGEIGLYAPGSDSHPRAMLAYLQWGSTPHTNTESAIDAGLWIEGAFAPSSDRARRLYRTEGGLWLFEE